MWRIWVFVALHLHPSSSESGRGAGDNENLALCYKSLFDLKATWLLFEDIK